MYFTVTFPVDFTALVAATTPQERRQMAAILDAAISLDASREGEIFLETFLKVSGSPRARHAQRQEQRRSSMRNSALAKRADTAPAEKAVRDNADVELDKNFD